MLTDFATNTNFPLIHQNIDSLGPSIKFSYPNLFLFCSWFQNTTSIIAIIVSLCLFQTNLNRPICLELPEIAFILIYGRRHPAYQNICFRVKKSFFEVNTDF